MRHHQLLLCCGFWWPRFSLFSHVCSCWLCCARLSVACRAVRRQQSDQPRRRRTFRKFSYRGYDLDALLGLSPKEVVELLPARPRRRMGRGLGKKASYLIKKLREAKKAAGAEKPECVNTHLRNMLVVPEMIGSVVGVYYGKGFTPVEIKAAMVGHYLGEFSISYRPVRHGRPGIGATHSSRFIPLK